MLTISIAPSLPELERMLGPELAKQARFALALSLTQTAGDARKRLIGGLPATFTVRSKFVASTMQTDQATKTNLVATVGSIQRTGSSLDMSLHATGGVRVAKGGGALGVPVGARPTPSAVTRPGSWPSAILEKLTVTRRPKRGTFGPVRKQRLNFVQIVRGKKGVWQRKGKARYPIRLLWLLEPEVKIDPTWPFEEQVRRSVLLDWHRRLREALDKAIKTRKR